jgi:hypothetical protein
MSSSPPGRLREVKGLMAWGQVYGESSLHMADGNTELHALEPTNPYAATKVIALLNFKKPY